MISFIKDELSEYEAGESFVHSLITNLDSLLSVFKDMLTTTNYDQFTDVLTEEVTTRLEKVILKSTFNRVSINFYNSNNSHCTRTLCNLYEVPHII